MQWRYSESWSTSRIRKTCSSSNNAKSSLAILPNSFVSSILHGKIREIVFLFALGIFSKYDYLFTALANFTVLPTVHRKIIDNWISWWHWLKNELSYFGAKDSKTSKALFEEVHFCRKKLTFSKNEKSPYNVVITLVFWHYFIITTVHSRSLLTRIFHHFCLENSNRHGMSLFIS